MTPLTRVVVALLAFCSLAFQGSSQAQSLYGPTLYGIVGLGGTGTPYHPRHLVRIDIATGAATVAEKEVNGITIPDGLAYNPDDKLLYAINGMNGTILTVDPADGSATGILMHSGSAVTSMAIAYRPADQALYVARMVAPGVYRLHRLNRVTGASIESVGSLGAAAMQGLSVRPSDQTLYGSTTDDNLVRIATPAGAGSDPLTTPTGYLHRVTQALAFHPDGTLYATDGAHLFTIDIDTGADTLIGAFGGNITTVKGLAFVTGWEPPPFPGPQPIAPDEATDPWGRPAFPGKLLLAGFGLGSLLWWMTRV